MYVVSFTHRGTAPRYPLWPWGQLRLNRNEYQVSPWGKWRVERKADSLTAFCEPIVYKMWEPLRLKTVWASTACYKNSYSCNRPLCCDA
jgi:hypothetical protein